MEFSDVVMNVGSFEINSSHRKQFCEASGVCSSRSFATTRGKLWQTCVIFPVFLILAFSISPSWSSTTLMSPWWWRPERSTASSPSWCRVSVADEVLSASSLFWWSLVTLRWSPSLWKPRTCSLLPKAVYQMSRSFTTSSMSMGETQNFFSCMSLPNWCHCGKLSKIDT